MPNSCDLLFLYIQITVCKLYIHTQFIEIQSYFESNKQLLYTYFSIYMHSSFFTIGWVNNYDGNVLIELDLKLIKKNLFLYKVSNYGNSIWVPFYGCNT